MISDPLCSLCTCQGYIAACTNKYQAVTIPVYSSSKTRLLRALIMNGTQVTLYSDSLLRLHWLGRLNLQSTGLHDQLPDGLFRELTNLFELDLSHNQLTSFQEGIFTGLTNLRKLDISSNLVLYLRPDMFHHLHTLQILNMSANPTLETASLSTFTEAVALQELHTDAFKFCCIAEHVPTCTPEADQFSSCQDLMANHALQISIWVLGLCAFFGNLFVIAWRVKTDNTRVSSFFIINLGCSDFLMGVYLLIIASVDVHYRGVYILHADAWRSGILCQLAGVLAMLSSEVSVFTLTIITLDRTLAIMYPLKMGKVRLKHARILMVLIWLAGFFLSILPTLGIPYFGAAFFGRTGQWSGLLDISLGSSRSHSLSISLQEFVYRSKSHLRKWKAGSTQSSSSWCSISCLLSSSSLGESHQFMNIPEGGNQFRVPFLLGT